MPSAYFFFSLNFSRGSFVLYCACRDDPTTEFGSSPVRVITRRVARARVFFVLVYFSYLFYIFLVVWLRSAFRVFTRSDRRRPRLARRRGVRVSRKPYAAAGMKEVVSVNSSSPPRPQLIKAKQPGYLDLTDEQVNRLISVEPIDKEYDVETEPFAR